MEKLRALLRRRPLVALVLLVSLLAIGYTARAVDHSTSTTKPVSSSAGRVAEPTPPASGLTPLSSLPQQARDTVSLIQRGGPFPYRQDGVVYNNLERQLPDRPRGFYREYTVRTPGSADRGARRIICGGGNQYFYTADHYASFVRIDLTR
jgi:ribonuclease T1